MAETEAREKTEGGTSTKIAKGISVGRSGEIAVKKYLQSTQMVLAEIRWLQASFQYLPRVIIPYIDVPVYLCPCFKISSVIPSVNSLFHGLLKKLRNSL